MRPSRLNMMVFCPEHPKSDQNPKFTPPKRDDERPHPFHMRSAPRVSVSLSLLSGARGVITPCSRRALHEDDWGRVKTGASIRTIIAIKPAIMKYFRLIS